MPLLYFSLSVFSPPPTYFSFIEFINSSLLSLVRLLSPSVMICLFILVLQCQYINTKLLLLHPKQQGSCTYNQYNTAMQQDNHGLCDSIDESENQNTYKSSILCSSSSSRGSNSPEIAIKGIHTQSLTQSTAIQSTLINEQKLADGQSLFAFQEDKHQLDEDYNPPLQNLQKHKLRKSSCVLDDQKELADVRLDMEKGHLQKQLFFSNCEQVSDIRRIKPKSPPKSILSRTSYANAGSFGQDNSEQQDYIDKQFELLSSNYDADIRRKSQDSAGSPKQPSYQSIDFLNRSIFTKAMASPPNSKKMLRDSSEDYNQESFKKEIREDQSFYMKPKKEDHPIQDDGQPQIETVISKKTDSQETIKIVFRGTQYFFELGKTSVVLALSTFRDLYEQFFLKNHFIPLFNEEVFQNWAQSKDQDKFSQSHELKIALKEYLDRYLEELNRGYKKQLIEVIEKLLKIQQGKQKKPQKQQIEDSSYFSILQNGISVSQVLEFVKKKFGSSKTDIAKKTLESKIKLLHSLSEFAKTQNSTGDQYLSISRQSVKKCQQKISQLQLLKSFQQTQEYCRKKLQAKLQKKFRQFWLSYRQKIRCDKVRYIAEVIRRIEV